MKKQHFVRMFGWFLLFISVLGIILFNGIGIYAGNWFYEEVDVAYARDHRGEDSKHQELLTEGKATKDWQDIGIVSKHGYKLQGTYIPSPRKSNKTLIFLHGFTKNRLYGLDYARMYLQEGYNLLLVDSKAHGDSGGTVVSWGIQEKDDVDSWVDWVQNKYPNGIIGVHGVSMGAATALMYAGFDETQHKVAFYVADSAYSQLEPLLKEKIIEEIKLPANSLLPDVLLFYSNIVSYYKNRYTFYGSSPLTAITAVTTPVLFIHGEADTLVPPKMSEDLYAAVKGPKELYIFPQAIHACAVYQDRKQYTQIVQTFIEKYGK
jgi:hypothetical protein